MSRVGAPRENTGTGTTRGARWRGFETPGTVVPVLGRTRPSEWFVAEATRLEAAGQTDEARRVAERGVGKHPQDAELWLTLGHLLAEPDPERAFGHFIRAAELNATKPNFLTRVALALLEIGQHDPVHRIVQAVDAMGGASFTSLQTLEYVRDGLALGPANGATRDLAFYRDAHQTRPEDVYLACAYLRTLMVEDPGHAIEVYENAMTRVREHPMPAAIRRTLAGAG